MHHSPLCLCLEEAKRALQDRLGGVGVGRGPGGKARRCATSTPDYFLLRRASYCS